MNPESPVQLPPLPEFVHFYADLTAKPPQKFPLFTAEQMREYALAALCAAPLVQPQQPEQPNAHLVGAAKVGTCGAGG